MRQTPSVFRAITARKKNYSMRSKALGQGGDKPGVNLTLDMKQCNNIIGGSSKPNPPPREVPHDTSSEPMETQTDTVTSAVNALSTQNPTQNPESILTQDNNPHKVERIRRIVQEVTIGPDTMPEQRQVVQNLLKGYTDCFALSIK